MYPILNEDERLDVVNDNVRLIQKKSGLAFGTDALLLASFIDEKKDSLAFEFGGGSGIISFLLLTRKKAARVTVAEVQSAYADLIQRNALLNGLESALSVVTADVRTLSPANDDGAYQYVFTNPPYMRTSGFLNQAADKAVARHEIYGDIGDFCRIASLKLKYGGHFYAVYRPDRLTDLLCAMRQYKLEPKKITFVHADAKSPPCLFLIKGKKGGGVGLTNTPPLVLHTDETHTANTEEHSYILEYGSFPQKKKRDKQKEGKTHE